MGIRVVVGGIGIAERGVGGAPNGNFPDLDTVSIGYGPIGFPWQGKWIVREKIFMGQDTTVNGNRATYIINGLRQG